MPCVTNVVKHLTRRITQVEAVLADLEPNIDTSPLNDPIFVAEKWRDTGYDG